MTDKDKERPLDTFKERVDICLSKVGMSRADLEHALGISQPALWQLLDRGAPRVSTLLRLSKVLGVSMSELMRPVSAEEYGSMMLAQKKEQE